MPFRSFLTARVLHTRMPAVSKRVNYYPTRNILPDFTDDSQAQFCAQMHHGARGFLHWG